MTAELDYLTQCAGKIDYRTRGAARQSRRSVAFDTLLHVYRCPHCAGIHLGNTTPPEQRPDQAPAPPVTELELAEAARAILRVPLDQALDLIRPAALTLELGDDT